MDGDSVILDVDVGFYLRTTLAFRLLGIDAPEMVGESKAAGLQAKSALQGMLTRGPIRIATHKADSFGRWLAVIYVRTEAGTEINVNDEMVKSGFAVSYSP